MIILLAKDAKQKEKCLYEKSQQINIKKTKRAFARSVFFHFQYRICNIEAFIVIMVSSYRLSPGLTCPRAR